MTKKDLHFLKQWFSRYCRAFYSSDTEDQKNILLKEEHTSHVCKNIVAIAESLSINKNKVLLAETVALFHDVGRFPQYAKYKTFNDSISVNHGMLGARTLIEENALQSLPAHEQELVIQSVTFHNAFSLPKKEKDETLFFIKLIRDADKLDIWRVFLEYYESSDELKASAVSLGLPDSSDYSQNVLSCIFEKRIVSLLSVKTMNDFKLLQLSWIFDLNFQPSFRLLCERNYVERIVSHLPRDRDIRKAQDILNEFIEQKMRKKHPSSPR